MKPAPKPRSKSERLRDASYASGGSTRMLPKQAANPQRPGVTSHAVKGSAPGAKRAAGGPRTSGLSSSTPARAGHTAPPRKGP